MEGSQSCTTSHAHRCEAKGVPHVVPSNSTSTSSDSTCTAVQRVFEVVVTLCLSTVGCPVWQQHHQDRHQLAHEQRHECACVPAIVHLREGCDWLAGTCVAVPSCFGLTAVVLRCWLEVPCTMCSPCLGAEQGLSSVCVLASSTSSATYVDVLQVGLERCGDPVLAVLQCGKAEAA